MSHRTPPSLINPTTSNGKAASAGAKQGAGETSLPQFSYSSTSSKSKRNEHQKPLEKQAEMFSDFSSSSSEGLDSKKYRKDNGQDKCAANQINNENDETILDVDMDDQNWTRAGSKTSRKHHDQRHQNRLPAIKIQINPVNVLYFQNQINLAQEILKNKPNVDPDLIKFASIKRNIVIIATDDEQTHAELSQTWPTDAFGEGSKLLIRRPQDTPLKIVIKGIHPDVDLKSNLVIDQLNRQGIQNPTRIMNRQTGEPTSLTAASVANRHILNQAIGRGVLVGLQRLPAQLEKPARQCFKCQKVGHTASACQNEQSCLRCGENHKHSQCQAETFKCVNCQGDHAACSRKCQYLKEATNVAINSQKARSYAAVIRQPKPQTQQKQQQPQSQQQTPSPDQQMLQQLIVQMQSQMKLITDQLSQVQKQLENQQNQQPNEERIIAKVQEKVVASISKDIVDNAIKLIANHFNQAKQTTTNNNNNELQPQLQLQPQQQQPQPQQQLQLQRATTTNNNNNTKIQANQNKSLTNNSSSNRNSNKFSHQQNFQS
jgi:Fe-S-cluster formation regulator IscX/YfhJ